MAKRFHVDLANPSFGVIEKGKGIVTILEVAEPLPPERPEPELVNEYIWECIFENLDGDEVKSVPHNSEEGYEYMIAHIDLEGDNEITWSHVARFIGDNPTGTPMAQNIDSGVGVSDNFGIFIDTSNGSSIIIKIMRRPLPVAADEDSRVTGNEFVRVSGNDLSYQWDLNYEYYITCTYGTLSNYTGTIITDEVSYGYSSIDKSTAWIANIDQDRKKWVGFGHKSSEPGNKSYRTVVTKRCDLHSVWRRPWSASSLPASEFANEHKRVKNNMDSPSTTLTFDWKDNKEYLVMMADTSSDNEVACAKVYTTPGLLEVPGVTRHKSGIAAPGGNPSWIEFLQTSVGGSKKIEAHHGYILNILERDMFYDPGTCGAEGFVGPVSSISSLASINTIGKIAFMSDTPGITKYGASATDGSALEVEAYIGDWTGNVPDVYNDKYTSDIQGIAIPYSYGGGIASNMTPSDPYLAESKSTAWRGWYLSVIDETEHTSGIKYSKITSIDINKYVDGHTLVIRCEDSADGDYTLESNSSIVDNNTGRSVSLSDIYGIRTKALHIGFQDTLARNQSGMDAEVTIAIEFEFHDGTMFSHTLTLAANSEIY